MLMCKFGCDELFEKGYISVDEGIFISLNKDPSTPELANYLESLIDNPCEKYNEDSAKYFEWHLKYHTDSD